MTIHLLPDIESGPLLVYGITTRRTALQVQGTEGLRGHGVEVVAQDGIAAMVEPFDPSRPLKRDEDLPGYFRVLDAAGAAAPVLPLRFGSVIRDRGVITELITRRRAQLTEDLTRLTGKVQLVIRVRYALQRVLEEIFTETEDARRLREQTRDLPEEVGQFQRMRLGEIVADEFEERRATDRARILPELTRHTSGWTRRRPETIDSLLELAVLVDSAHCARVRESARQVGLLLRERADVQLIGPMAPFDFTEVA